ncbi:MAG: Flp family type IVb pilin [Bdellovibrionales bacterium]|nr:Flp family type IVb pilin [Bdellovibrionales bacterium]
MRSLKNARGQSLIEYVILVALVAVATMGIVRTLQATIRTSMTGVVNALQGNPNRPNYTAPDRENANRRLDFSDFMNGAASRE